MKTKTIICARCGKNMEVPASTKRLKYCPGCRDAAYRERGKNRKSAKKAERTEKSEWYLVQAMDTPENIAICLSCHLKECHMESAGCGRVRR